MRNRGYQMKRVLTSSASALVAILFLGIMMMSQPLANPGTDDAHIAHPLGSNTAVANVTVIDDVGRPMAKAEVRLVGGSSFWLTDDNGTALINGLYANDTAPGTSYNFTAHLTGYRSTVTQAWLFANLTNYVVILVEGGTILGTVTSQGLPVNGVNVSIKTLGLSNYTGADGRYQLDGIPAGTHDVTAVKTGYDNKTETVVLAVGGVYLRDFSLTQQTGSISGFVKNAAGALLSGANLTIKVGLSTITVPTNVTGSYELEDLPEGLYSVTASLSGFYSNTTNNIPVIRGNQTENVNFTLIQKPNRVYGVVKARTLLLPGVNVSIVGTGHYNISDYEGGYEINNISAGVYNISASLEGYETNITQVTILPGSDVLLYLDLRELPGSQLLVRLTASDTSEPLVGVVITISGSNIDPQSQSTNIDGKFAFTGLDPGNYTLQLVKDGYKPVEVARITLGEGQNLTLSLTMDPLRKGDTGFIFGFDMAHSMMILALFLTIVILAMAVWLRIKTFQAPESAPAVYDEEPEKTEDEHSEAMKELADAPEKDASGRGRAKKEKNGK